MAENFDPIFTKARVELTPLDRNALMILQHMNTADFAEFDWVNPDFQPIVDPPLIWSPFHEIKKKKQKKKPPNQLSFIPSPDPGCPTHKK